MPDQAQLEIFVSQQAGYAGVGEAVAEKAKDAFDALGSMLSEAIEPLRQKLTETVASADEIELKLDLAFQGGTHWAILSAQGGATVSVKMVWKRKQ